MKIILEMLIKKYQNTVSFVLKRHGYRCLYEPTCSQYALDTLEKISLLKALPLIILRLLSCNPVNAYIKSNQKEVVYGKGI